MNVALSPIAFANMTSSPSIAADHPDAELMKTLALAEYAWENMTNADMAQDHAMQLYSNERREPPAILDWQPSVAGYCEYIYHTGRDGVRRAICNIPKLIEDKPSLEGMHDSARLQLAAILEGWVAYSDELQALRKHFGVDAAEEAAAAMQEQWELAVAKVRVTPATSLDGLRAKARFIQSVCYSGDPVEASSEDTNDYQIMVSIVNDLLAA